MDTTTDLTEKGAATRAEVEKLIGSLPTSAGGVADFLVEKGIKGVVAMACACPLARYIRSELEIPTAVVDLDKVDITTVEGERFTLPLPDYAEQFVLNFDMNEYPDLEDDEPTDEEVFMEDRLYQDMLDDPDDWEDQGEDYYPEPDWVDYDDRLGGLYPEFEEDDLDDDDDTDEDEG